MDDDIPSLIERYASRGVLVDTNLLLLYVVGRTNSARIERFKRTKQFTAEDFQTLGRFLHSFHRRLTTPCVLTEVSNFASQLGEPERSRCLETLGREIESLEEHYEPSFTLAGDELFREVGLTDCSIRRLAEKNLLVLTDDYKLANRLHSLDLAAINFNHLRRW